MSLDCLVVSFGTTNVAKQYIIKSGDTLVAIAKKSLTGAKSTTIPGQSSTDILPLPQSGGGGFGFARVPLLLNLRGK